MSTLSMRRPGWRLLLASALLCSFASYPASAAPASRGLHSQAISQSRAASSHGSAQTEVEGADAEPQSSTHIPTIANLHRVTQPQLESLAGLDTLLALAAKTDSMAASQRSRMATWHRATREAHKRMTARSRRRLHGLRPMPHTWPGYLIPERERHLGVVYQGDWGRLRAAIARLQRTGHLTVSVIGGSITAGAGALNTHNWVEWFEDYLGDRYNGSRDAWVDRDAIGDPRVRVANGAVPGTYSSYMSVCYNLHVPQDADVVIVEYALNDEHTGDSDRFNNLVRRAFERLLRKLLSYPKHPAVILLNAYMWFQPDHTTRYDGMYNTGGDSDFLEFANYYQLPMLSIRAACWRLMHQGVVGFQVNRTRGTKEGTLEPEAVDAPLRETQFYWDKVHPNGETGHRAMADLVVFLFSQIEKSLVRRPWTDQEAQRVTQRTELLPPMIRGNWESLSDRCFVGDTLKHLVQSASQDNTPEDTTTTPTFVWTNDQPPGRKPKWGYIANTTGAVLRFTIDTRTTSSRAVEKTPQNNTNGFVGVEVAYLRSYKGMGQASITCVENCLCKPSSIDGLNARERVSLVALHEVKVTKHERCVIEVSVTGHTSSTDPADKGTKVKITGLMISDEGADMQAEGKDLKAFGALDFITEGLRPNQSFTIQNTWERPGMDKY